METDACFLPPLQIVMLIVGTRGDVQPFIAIGKRLQVRSEFFLTKLAFKCFLRCICTVMLLPLTMVVASLFLALCDLSSNILQRSIHALDSCPLASLLCYTSGTFISIFYWQLSLVWVILILQVYNFLRYVHLFILLFFN